VSNCAFNNDPITSGFQNVVWTDISIDATNSFRLRLSESRNCIAAIPWTASSFPSSAIMLLPSQSFTEVLPEFSIESSTASNNRNAVVGAVNVILMCRTSKQSNSYGNDIHHDQE
jgi:hypothetical protein